MTERHEDRRQHTDKSADETNGADKLRKDLAVQNGDVADLDSPRQSTFSESLRTVIAEARAGRQRIGEDADFEVLFRQKLASLASPGELELSLVSLSHGGKSKAFIRILSGVGKHDTIEKFLQQELKLEQTAISRIVKPPLLPWLGRSATESVTVLPVSQSNSPWLKQILQENSDIPGAHVGLALSRRYGELHIGLLVSLEPLEVSPGTRSQEKTNKGSLGSAVVSQALGPLLGMAQNAGDYLLRLYCGATAKRKKIEPPASFSELHRISAYVYTFFAAPQILGALLLGTPLNPSLALKYAMVVVATNFGSWLWERGRERYQRALSKKPENEEKKAAE